MFAKLLIANRGEIACRVIATARRLGVRTVAVYSDADRDARHVRLADEAVHIGAAPARESYLDAQRILAAARATGAQAVHPGYGFLSENEGFAAACRAAGIVFVGPTPEAIAAMGDKAAAKALMDKAGVPLVPGYHGENQDAKFLQQQADAIGYPVLIKASAGGGGKGMRVVEQAADFAAALASCRREAQSSFGDARVLLERYLSRPRHIEIQVFGDTQGSVVHLFERDCSVQRRHQKVLEEAPAPGMSAARRAEMGAAAVAAARAIGYTGAGTVEFIVETDAARPGALGERFYFMEMNTRLQVEHPVTEMITGHDLVEWQLRVAAGEPLPMTQAQLSISGHAIEARIYAEDPAREFLPQTGRIAHLAFAQGAGVRVDTGVLEGAEIGPHYDPMIAKLIVHGADRAQALAAEAAEPPDAVLALAAWAALEQERSAARARAAASADPHAPWNDIDGWRMNQASHHAFVFTLGERTYAATLLFGTPLRLELASGVYALEAQGLAEGELLLRLDGRTVRGHAVRSDDAWTVFHAGDTWRLALRDELHELQGEAHGGSLAAPMPGRIVAVLVQAGARVEKGAPLVILEAMKMEHTITAPRAGTVSEIRHAAGEQVAEGSELIVLSED
ncbi:MAG: ATP-grasp domain-containing protein [Betaproteobacteria bacterium]|nr:ATP-grasp domain-containing protein [Betaproteobacteria bacterium]